jgi:hypothetical protein
MVIVVAVLSSFGLEGDTGYLDLLACDESFVFPESCPSFLAVACGKRRLVVPTGPPGNEEHQSKHGQLSLSFPLTCDSPRPTERHNGDRARLSRVLWSTASTVVETAERSSRSWHAPWLD